MPLIKLHFPNLSIRKSASLRFSFDFVNRQLLEPKPTNININISQVSFRRNEFKFGFGCTDEIVDHTLNINRAFPDSFQEGIYFISSIKLIFGNPENPDYLEKPLKVKSDFDLVYFYVTDNENDPPKSLEEINNMLRAVLQMRKEYRNKPYITPNSKTVKTQKLYTVSLFCSGCLIRSVQKLNGLTIYPINNKTSYKNLNHSVSEYLTRRYGFDKELELVPKYEKTRLEAIERFNLANRLEQVAETKGDWAGYDIRSFDDNGNDRFIKVKTTRYGIDTPFLVTKNELGCSTENSSNYNLYRVFAFHKNPKLFMLQGSLDKSCQLEAVQFKAHI